MTKKILALVLAVVMAVGLFAGCNANSGTNTTAASTTKAASTTAGAASTTEAEKPLVNDWGTLPIVNEEITITIGSPTAPLVTDWNDNYATYFLEEKTGINVEFTNYPADEFTTKIELLMAAGGDDLPNVLISGGFSNSDTSKWGQAGHIVDVTEYYDDMYWTPLAVENTAFYDWDTAKIKMANAEGRIYRFPYLAESYNNRISGSRIMFYTPWLEELGMFNLDENGEFFTSLDQAVAYWEAVKTTDLNGNGLSDEIPLTGYLGNNIKNAFLTPFMKTNADSFYIDTATDTIKFNYDREEYREGLRFIKSLIDNGYLDPLALTQDHATMNAQITGETLLVGSYLRISNSNLNATTVPSLTEYEFAMALSAPGSTERFNYIAALSYGGGSVITKTCENVEAAVKMFDYWGGEEFSWVANMGVEGEDWDYASNLDGSIEYGNMYGLPLEKTYIQRTLETGGRFTYGTAHNVTLSSWGPRVLNMDWANGGGNDTSTEEWLVNQRHGQKTVHVIENYTNEANVLSGQVYTNEEIELRSEIWSPINTYVNECYTRFILGDLSLDSDWDGYVAELYKMGLQDIIDLENNCYDRMYK